jgi:hypothetical protein
MKIKVFSQTNLQDYTSTPKANRNDIFTSSTYFLYISFLNLLLDLLDPHEPHKFNSKFET